MSLIRTRSHTDTRHWYTLFTFMYIDIVIYVGGRFSMSFGNHLTWWVFVPIKGFFSK